MRGRKGIKGWGGKWGREIKLPWSPAWGNPGCEFPTWDPIPDPSQVQEHLWMFLEPWSCSRAELFSHLPCSPAWSIPRIPALDPRTFLQLLRAHCSRAAGSAPVTAPQPEPKFHSMKKAGEYFGKWHRCSTCGIPKKAPCSLQIPTLLVKTSTPRKWREFTSQTFLWKFSPSPFPPLPSCIWCFIPFLPPIILKFPFPSVSNCHKSWNCSLKGIPGFQSQ